MKNIRPKNKQFLIKIYNALLVDGEKSEEVIAIKLSNKRTLLDFYLNVINVINSLDTSNVECEFLNQ